MHSTIHTITQKRAFALIVLLAMAFGPFSSAFAVQLEFPNNPNVTICHATASEQNPYTDNTVDANSIINEVNGHGTHEADIIPPFSYDFGGEAVGSFVGQNWTAENQELHGNGCVAPLDIVTCNDSEATNYEEEGACVYEDTDTDDDSEGACEFEGHKYDEKGNPLSDWAIGLMKVLTFGDRSDTADLDEATTDKDGYYCLEWDGYTGTEVVEEPHSFMYRVYEVLKEGWTNVSVEMGTKDANEANALTVVDDADIKTEDGRTSVQVGETNGYVYADDAYHVDFYNKQDVVIDPCDVEESTTTEQVSRTVETDCDEDDDSDEEYYPVCEIAVVEDIENEPNTETLAWVSLDATSATLTQFGAIASTSVATGTAVVTTTGLEETFALTVFDDTEASSTCSVIVNAPADSSNGGGGGGGGRSGSRKSSNNDTPEGEVAGDSTSNSPKGEVLGAATDAMPLGAPATGAGATSPIGVTLPNLTAILGCTATTRRTKNGY